jgi:Na+/phosphate symporter
MTVQKLEQYLNQIEDIVFRLKESDLTKFTSEDKEVIFQLQKEVEWIGDLLRANKPND